jgi:hypothetical protein
VAPTFDAPELDWQNGEADPLDLMPDLRPCSRLLPFIVYYADRAAETVGGCSF